MSQTPGRDEKTLRMDGRELRVPAGSTRTGLRAVQFVRELTQNSLESGATQIVWDADWILNTLDGVYKLAIIDNGSGMVGTDMVRFINQLSSSIHAQSHEGNFGVGAKIAAATAQSARPDLPVVGRRRRRDGAPLAR